MLKNGKHQCYCGQRFFAAGELVHQRVGGIKGGIIEHFEIDRAMRRAACMKAFRRDIKGNLRHAFDATMKDQDFIAEANKLELDLNPATGEAIAEVARDTINAPPELIARAKAAIEPAGGGKKE